jgi:peptidylprolyl isomerase
MLATIIYFTRHTTWHPSVRHRTKIDVGLWQDVPADKQAQATTLLADIEKELGELATVIEGKTNKAVAAKKRAVLDKIGELEQLMVQAFPYE